MSYGQITDYLKFFEMALGLDVKQLRSGGGEIWDSCVSIKGILENKELRAGN